MVTLFYCIKNFSVRLEGSRQTQDLISLGKGKDETINCHIVGFKFTLMRLMKENKTESTNLVSLILFKSQLGKPIFSVKLFKHVLRRNTLQGAGS